MTTVQTTYSAYANGAYFKLSPMPDTEGQKLRMLKREAAKQSTMHAVSEFLIHSPRFLQLDAKFKKGLYYMTMEERIEYGALKLMSENLHHFVANGGRLL